MYFASGETELAFLRHRDKRLCEGIDRIWQFEKYRRFHPYGSAASLYLWAASGGAIPEMSDPQPKAKNGGK